MWKFVAFLVIVFCIYLGLSHDSPKPPALATPAVSASADSSTTNTDTDADTDTDSPAPGSSSWGSGHQAGYDWAEENSIDDEDACEEAGDSHNSPSFAEGCKSYVQENQ